MSAASQHIQPQILLSCSQVLQCCRTGLHAIRSRKWSCCQLVILHPHAMKYTHCRERLMRLSSL